jgi:MYXO-CTERM domain-containing protein
MLGACVSRLGAAAPCTDGAQCKSNVCGSDFHCTVPANGDAGADAGDGGAGPTSDSDGSLGDAPPADASGCGCTIPGAPLPAWPGRAAAFGVLALVGLRFRRRRR